MKEERSRTSFAQFALFAEFARRQPGQVALSFFAISANIADAFCSREQRFGV